MVIRLQFFGKEITGACAQMIKNENVFENWA